MSYVEFENFVMFQNKFLMEINKLNERIKKLEEAIEIKNQTEAKESVENKTRRSK